MFLIILLIAAGSLFASPVNPYLPMNPDSNGVIYSSLTVTYDATPSGVVFTISDPVHGPQNYDAGQIWFASPVRSAAMIGETVALVIDNGHGETPAFLIHYNDGLACGVVTCSLYTAPNVVPIPRSAEFPRFQKWDADQLTISYPDPTPWQSLHVPYRFVIPEPSTSALATLALATLAALQYKRSR